MMIDGGLRSTGPISTKNWYAEGNEILVGLIMATELDKD